MCGIAGVISLNGAAVPRGLVEAMTRLQAHRGPDGEGVWHNPDGTAVLGHRRLAILDLTEAGAQPMLDRGGQRALTYNGEIFNYLELKAELGGAYPWRTQSDTEVLLACVERWGDAAMSRFNGMWAFALWDEASRTLLCSRDRFGKKPLYYYHDKERFIFASELKAVVQAMRQTGVGVRAAEHRLAEALHGFNPSDLWQSSVAGVRHLPAGCSATLHDGELQLSRYYDLETAVGAELATHHGAPAATWVERFRATFTDAVRLRLRSDVPVGSCLSGGWDSSAIVCTVRGLRGENAPPQHTFSAVYDDFVDDESRYIDAVVAHTGVHGHRVKPSGERLAQELRQFLWHQDEPVPTTSMFTQYCVFALAQRQGVKVVLDGQGADEILGGYDGYFVPRWLEALLQGKLGTLHREVRGFKELRGGGVPAAYGLLLRWLLRRQSGGLLQPLDVLREPHRSISKLLRLPRPSLQGRADAATPLRHRLGPLRGYAIAKTSDQSLVDLLRFEDRNAMAFGIEARVPFLDYRLVPLAIAAPPELHIDAGRTKELLRRAVGERLPALVRARTDKKGFPTPMERWLAEDLAPAVRALFADERARARGWYDTKALLALHERVGRGTVAPPLVHALWRSFCVEAWARLFIDGETP